MSLRAFFVALAFAVVAVVAIAGFRGRVFTRPPIEIFSDMVRQPKVKAQEPSQFFSDGRAARLPVAGTVPLGYAMPGHKFAEGSPGPYTGIRFSSGAGYFDTGKMGAEWGTGLPVETSLALLGRGRERFGIFCASCHGTTGNGDGMAQKFGLVTVVTLNQDRLRAMADGEIFNTITNGKNTMPGYGDRIPVGDRWAIIGYLRALQLSQGGATIDDVPPAERGNLGP